MAEQRQQQSGAAPLQQRRGFRWILAAFHCRSHGPDRTADRHLQDRQAGDKKSGTGLNVFNLSFNLLDAVE